MTAPIQPSRFDRSAAKRAGYSDAEIDDFLTRETEVPVKRQGDSITRPKSDSFAVESSTTPATHRPDVTGQPNDWPELVREVGRGATFGLSDRVEAGARALGDETYSGVRDEQKANRRGFQQRNPVTATVANAAGGLVTGSAVAKGLGALPGVGRLVTPGLTAGSRVGSATASGAIQGGAAGFLSADGSLGDRTKAGAAGALTGGALSGTLAAAAEALRGGAGVYRGVRDAYRGRGGRPVTIDPNQAARETLPILERSGKSIDELRAADRVADAPDNLAELMDGEFGKTGRAQLGSAHRYGLRPQVEESLTRRARDESGRARQALDRNGVRLVDDEAFAAGKLKEAQDAAAPLYEEALTGRTVTDPKFVDLVGRPTGGKAYNEARTHMLDRGEGMPPLENVLERAKGPSALNEPAAKVKAPVTGASDPLAGMSPRRKLSEVPVEELSPDQLRKLRTSRPLDSMTDRQLAVESHYLNLLDAKDAEAASFLELPVHAAVKGTPGARFAEDRIGVLQEHGFQDPTEFAAAKFRAGEAAVRMQKRASKIKSVRDELTAREGLAAAPVAQAGAPDAVPSLPAVDPVARARSGDALPERAGELPTVPAKQVQRIKLALDDRLKDLEGKSGGTSTQRYRDLIGLRDDFDNLLYEHAPGYDKAQAAYAKPMQERDAFMSGRLEGRTMTEADVPRMLAGENRDYTARGVGSTLAEDVARLNDGTTGAVQNPAPTLIGNSRARARLAVATGGDAAKVGDVTKAAQGIDRRFRTKNAVLGGSQTAERLADDLQEMGGAVASNVAQGKFKSALDVILKPVNQAARGASLDRRASLLLAMGDDRKKALDLLEAARPLLIRSGFRQSVGTSTAGRLAGDATGRGLSRR